MLIKKVQLLAAVDSFKFTDGSRDFVFDTKLFLDSKGLIAGVGSKPADYDHQTTEVKVFEDSERSLDLLVAAIHYGLQQFSGRLRILPSHLDVHVAQDLVRQLRGFEKPIFERAGKDACASTVSVSRLADRSETKQQESFQL